ARLDRRLPLLTVGAQDLPARQQTLRAAIDWSYDLLSVEQQALFRQLAVFVGGCSLDAAERVCSPDSLPFDVIREMAALVNQGLVRQGEQADGEPRFVLLESIREYALERLTASGALGLLQRRHAHYYLQMAEAGEGAYQYLDARILDRLENEHANLRAALRWCETEGATAEGARLAGALTWFWLSRNDWTEGRHWLEHALAIAPTAVADAERGLVLLGAGIFALAQGDLGPARARLEQCVAIWRAQGDRRHLATALAGLASVAVRDRDPAAWPIAAESLDLFRQLGHQRGTASLQLQLGSIATYLGDYGQAEALLTEARDYLLQSADLASLASADWRLGSLAMAQRDYGAARAHFQRSLAVCRKLAPEDSIARQTMAVTLTRLAELDDHEGDVAAAMERCQEALQLARALGDQDIVAWTLTTLGRAVRQQGEEQRAMTYFREALLLRRDQGHVWALLVCLGELAEGAVLAGQHERAVRLYAAVAGQRATGAALAVDGDLSGYDPARTERHLALLRAALPPSTFAGAWADGAARSLQQAVALAAANL
ncbi:MAG TPA: tetratricopeptide repeat protein, partial [Chloroflexota bacterium]|nr:tetratricopeptide repeat protein [Chloroflexota bacterium]